jgi:DNA gyrase subunit B
MPELVRQNRIFIAQPPLYLVTRGKKSEYVLNERKMRAVLGELGVDGTTLVVYGPNREELRRLNGETLRGAFETLQQIQDIIHIVERRGLAFSQLLASRAGDPKCENRLPRIHLFVPTDLDGGLKGGDYFFWSEQDEDAFREAHGLGSTDPALDKVIGEDGKAAEAAEQSQRVRRATRKELHEVKDLERHFVKLNELGLDIEDYALAATQTVTGVAGPTKFELLHTDGKGVAQVVPVVNLGRVAQCILEVGKHGMDIKRFKGLGEMDAEQLWETTMNPANRMLLRVTWDAASDAELLFSILMGEEVEPRRKYIETHALEVKNLDV